jgi:hypothetical protein
MATVLKYLCAIYVLRTTGYKIIKLCDVPHKENKMIILKSFCFPRHSAENPRVYYTRIANLHCEFKRKNKILLL